MSKSKQIVKHLIPFVVTVGLVQWLWTYSIVLLVVCLGIAAAQILTGKNRCLESKIMLYGIIWGVVLELISTNVSHFHSFPKPDFLGVPAWLPVLWGYGFVMAKRISSILYTGTPWHFNQA